MTPWQALRRAGVLGINQRNVDYIMPHNPRQLFPRVDDKLLTKRLCQDAGIPVPRLLAAAHSPFDLKHTAAVLRDTPCFVMKPARGAMGNGTLVVRSVEEGAEGARFLASGGRSLTTAALVYHGSGIIAGLYSLGGQNDAAMVEELLVTHPALAPLSYEGVPDVRVIVYRGVPVMSMMRLPTRGAAGRANLHQGAVGVGIDLWRGVTSSAVWRNQAVRDHPDVGAPLLGLPVPHFERALEIAVRAADESSLGYVGADVVIDAHLGPVILELNARPGLAIQLANQSGLLPRLQRVDDAWRQGQLGQAPLPDTALPAENHWRMTPVSERVALGKDIAAGSSHA